MLKTINRDVLILFPKQPLIDWVNYIFPDNPVECPKPLTHDAGNVFLIPIFDHPNDAIEYLKHSFIPIFHEQLSDWTTDKTLWPETLTWELFEKWFHYSIQTIIFDTLDENINHEDLNRVF